MNKSKTTRSLTAQEVKRMLEAAKKHRNPRYRLLMAIMAYWGLRVGEATAITWGSLLNKRYKPHDVVSYKPQKRQSVLKRYMNDELSQIIAETLAAIMEKEDYRPELSEHIMISKTNGGLVPSPQGIIQAIKHIAVTAFISPNHLANHSFRKAFANSIADEATAMALLGHSSIEVTRKYKTSEDAIQRAVIKGISFK
jgi:integrase